MRRLWEKMRGEYGQISPAAPAALLIFLSAGALFLHDQKSTPSPHVPPYGRITPVGPDVRRQGAFSFQWSPVRTVGEVFPGEDLFVGPGSRAELEMASSVLRIDANTGVRFKLRETLPEIEMRQGLVAVEFHSATRIFVSRGSEALPISGANCAFDVIKKISRGDSKIQIQIEVLDGEVKVQDQTVRAGSVAFLTEGGTLEIKTRQISLLSPQPRVSSWFAPGANLNFVWKKSAQLGALPMKIEFARDLEFTEVIHSAPVDGEAWTSVRPGELKGHLYWRVAAENARDETLSSVVRSVGVFPDEPPSLRYPTDKTSFLVDPAQKLKSVLFGWTDETGAEAFDLEVATDEAFGKIAHRVRFETVSFGTTVNLPKGDYYWRVRGQNPERAHPPWSRYSSFSVSDVPPATESGPLAHVPEVPQVDVSGLSPEMPLIKDATDVFRSRDEFLRGRHEFTAKWSALPGVTDYELQWGADREFRRLKRFRVKGTERIQVVSSPMKYYARVRAIDESGQPRSQFSRTRMLKYDKVLRESAPVFSAFTQNGASSPRKPASLDRRTQVPRPLEPGNDTSLVIYETQTTPVEFRWEAQTPSAEYEFQLAADPDFQDLITTKKTRKNFVKVSAQIPEGRVYWRVRKPGETQGEWSETALLHVLYE